MQNRMLGIGVSILTVFLLSHTNPKHLIILTRLLQINEATTVKYKSCVLYRKHWIHFYQIVSDIIIFQNIARYDTEYTIDIDAHNWY